MFSNAQVDLATQLAQEEVDSAIKKARNTLKFNFKNLPEGATVGFCLNCTEENPTGELVPIHPKRMETMPYAYRCVYHQDLFERGLL